MTLTRSGRFVNNYISKLQQDNWNPISGYKGRDLKSLEQAVESIFPVVDKVKEYAEKAKQNCKKNTELTINESAAIYLYTMDEPFYEKLNDALRGENPPALVLWFDFLKLFITALAKLPSCQTTVWRGVANISGSDFHENNVFTWWSVNSCSSHASVAKIFTCDKGILFCINTIYGKDISAYSSAKNGEEEVVLMPGSRLRVKSNTGDVFSVVHLEECTIIPEGKHIMLSYHSNSQETVSKICHRLQLKRIPLWFNEQKETMNNLKESLAEGVENAAVVCCFMTSNYQKSDFCQLELQYAQKRHKRIIPCMLDDTKVWKPSDWLDAITRNLEPVDFHNVSESNIGELIYRIEEQPPAAQYISSQRDDQPSYLFELIKYEYKRNSRIERFMNPAVSFSIEQSYINLAIIGTKEQQEKEKKLGDSQDSSAIMDVFEEIHGIKTPIDVKDIFKTCRNAEKQVLVFGRAGIGKSTFCRYVAYQWATGMIWPEYELVALIPLRSLIEQDYPAGRSYSPIDVLKTEYFSFGQFQSEKDEILLQKQFHNSRIIWLLDGYDEIVQNVPKHLTSLLNDQLLKTPHHIVTSRPYMNTLSYPVRMEITGFTNENIRQYAKQFFDPIGSEAQNSSHEDEKILSFLKRNPRIWGIAHVPIHLELICSVWSNTNWSEMKTMKITVLYDKLTEWICRRYLKKQQGIPTDLLRKKDVYEKCKNELAFLESLAFLGMNNNAIILRPALLEEAENESNCSLTKNRDLLNIGILKSFSHHQGTGTRIEADKDYYFVHLSFQEYFAARYLINALRGSSADKAIEFIKYQKYNQRYALLFTFASGLLSVNDSMPCINIFSNTILGEPLDLVGIRHMQLVISCLEETSYQSTVPRRTELLEWIAKCIQYSFSNENQNHLPHLLQSLQGAPSVACDQTIINVLVNLLQSDGIKRKSEVLSFISQLNISNPSAALITSITTALNNQNIEVRKSACCALGKMGENAATNEVISKLVSALGDESEDVRGSACEALGKIGEKAATNEVISKLVSALGDESEYVRRSAAEALGTMGDKAATNEVISKLVSALGDQSEDVRMGACYALGKMGKKAATIEGISKLVSALGDQSEDVRMGACYALGKMGKKAATIEGISKLVSALGDESEYVRRSAGEALGKMSEKAATNEVISKLVSALGDDSKYVRRSAGEALGTIGDKAATNEVISKLVSALGDKSEDVRMGACYALGKMGEKAATNEVISKLVNALGDDSVYVRRSAGEALGTMGDKTATNEVISKLVSALGDQSEDVRISACEALGKMGEKAATNEVISKLVNALGDDSEYVRRSAGEALGTMGDKAATNEVISKLVSALGDKSEYVRWSACEALGKMGEKAATNEVISKLVSALGDESEGVRWSACEALGKMGEKAATSEVISKLVSALGDKSEDVRMGACYALRKMGEKAVTNEVISKLVSALGDKSEYVRRSACEALGKMGEKAATNEVISKLVSALGDWSEYVRRSACEALGKMGEKAATNEVISKLVSALGDWSEYVRRSACEALGKMGEKAATNEVISKLVSAVGDESEDVRRSACEALGKMGEKAATNEVISKLVSAVEDERVLVRESACFVLGKMGQKAATSEVISKLVSALGDASNDVWKSAREALENMGEKAATNEVISKLVSALGDHSAKVRRGACEALGKMGEKAATNEVISKLVSALGDQSEDVRRSARKALGKMGDKAAKNEVISNLIPLLDDEYYVSYLARDAVKNILSSFVVLTRLEPKLILDLWLSKYGSKCLENISSEQLMNFFVTTKNCAWLPVVTHSTLLEGVAVIAAEDTVVIYGRKEPLELPIPNSDVRHQLVESFTDQAKRLYLAFEMSSEV